MGKGILGNKDGRWKSVVVIGGLILAFFIADRFFTAVANYYFPSSIVPITVGVIHIVFICFCIVAVLGYSISSTYRRRTGRNFLEDRLTYNKTYHELVRFYEDADPYQLDTSTLPQKNWKDADGIILGKVGDRLIYRPTDGEGNLAVFALPGGGKTTAQLVPSALRFGGSVLAVDIKGDILNQTKNSRTIKVFAPDDPTHSYHYNPMARVPYMTVDERRTYIEQLSMILLPDSQEKDGKYFVDGGRDFFCGIALFLLDQEPETTLPDIATAIVTGNVFTWAKQIDASSCQAARAYVSAYIGTNEKNVAGAFGTIVKALRPFSDGNLAKLLVPNDTCITPEMLDEGYDIYIEIPQDKMKYYTPITTVLVNDFMRFFMQRPDKSTGEILRPILFLLDEFPQLRFDYDTVTEALATLRSKSVTLFLASQSIAQLEQRYGEYGFRAIIGTISYISIMSAQDPNDRDYFSRLCGTKKVLKVSVTRGENNSSRNITEDREPVFQPADFGNLGDHVVIYAHGKYVKAEKTYCYK